MNANPSNFPQIADAARLAEPGFDILRAVSDARQSALPTVRMLRAQAIREDHAAHVNALTHLLGAGAGDGEPKAQRPVRFFDLSDDANVLPETVNEAFTRGFQPMLNPLPVEPSMSATPIPHDEDDME